MKTNYGAVWGKPGRGGGVRFAKRCLAASTLPLGGGKVFRFPFLFVCLFVCPLAYLNKNSSGDEIANVNFYTLPAEIYPNSLK